MTPPAKAIITAIFTEDVFLSPHEINWKDE
jgi:hypothetical protein